MREPIEMVCEDCGRPFLAENNPADGGVAVICPACAAELAKAAEAARAALAKGTQR